MPNFVLSSKCAQFFCLEPVLFACGRYGIRCGRCGLWPISSVADIVVADMVCGRYRRKFIVMTATFSLAEAAKPRDAILQCRCA